MTKTQTPLISIIIPIYNTDKYLDNCLKSILLQTYKNFECLLIDDGSSDNSGNICEKYANIDHRFTVIHKKNEGLSTARNIGLSLAKGEYISFIDSDDFIDITTLEKCVKYAIEYSADLIQYGIVLENSNTIFDKHFCKEGLFNNNDIYVFFEPSTWNKLINKKIIDFHNISFPNGITLSEDKYFSFLCYMYSERIVGINECLYHYEIHANSSTHKMNEKNLKDEIIITNILEKLLLDKKIYRKELFDLIIQFKIDVKNHSLFLINPPNSKLFRALYPEVFIKMYKCASIKQKILYTLAYLHFDTLILFLFKRKYNKKL